MLSDSEIQHALRWRGLEIQPFNEGRLQAASVDLTLHESLQILRDGIAREDEPLDPRKDCSEEFFEWTIGPEGFELKPGWFALGSTEEVIRMGNTLVGKLEGKSSLGRLGLAVHSTAGFLDPGFHGQVTLEISSMHSRGIRLYAGMPIGQVAFDDVRNVARPYGGKYVGQRGPTLSRYHQNWDATQAAWL